MSNHDESPPPSSAVHQTREHNKKTQLFKDRCWKVIQDKWAKVREDCSVHWNNEMDAKDCQMEKQIIREHVEVLELGVYMSIVVFGTLRLTSHPKFDHVANTYIKPFFRLTPPPPPSRNRGSSSSSSKLRKFNPSKKNWKKENNKNSNNSQSEEKITVVGNNKTQAHSKLRNGESGFREKTYLERQRDLQVQKINTAVEPFYDMFVSLIVGISSVFFFSRPAQIRLDFEEAPFCPGRSFWCENMCDDFIKIMQETDPKVFDFDGEEKVDANLKSFQKFAVHCQLRAAFIQQRKEAGEAKPLVIPTSGPWEEEQEEDQDQNT